MARYGFHGGVTELRIAALFALRRMLWHPTREELTDAVFLDENMDYFQFCDAVQSLTENGQLTQDASGRYALTEQGAQNAGAVGDELPAALRRAIEEGLETRNEQARRDACLHTETVTRRGEYYAVCVLSDGERPMLRLELLAGGEKQAQALARRFRERAERLHQEILASLS
jgi:hypothetical protein